MQLPESFEKELTSYLNTELTDFKMALSKDAPTSARINPKKPSVIQQSKPTVSWCSDGFYFDQRPVFTLDPRFHAGAYYVQEASSMFIAEIIRQVVPKDKKIKALDLCAAPGGKSTLLAAALSDDSFLLTNEVIRSRVSILKQNIHKWGYPNVAVSNHDSRDFKGLKQYFDLVLVDAPCSGEGLFRKDQKAIEEWSPENVQLCYARQRRILEEAAPLVKEGGLLIYSTCTYNHFENEDTGQWLIENHDFEQVHFIIHNEWNIEQRRVGYQFYPHRVKGEGFFVACFRKKMEQTQFKANSILKFTNFSMKRLPKKQVPLIAPYLQSAKDFSFFIKSNQQIVAIPSSQVDICMHIDQVLQRKGFGIEMGQFKRDQFIPSHQLALSTAISTNVQHIELTKEQALIFLKKEVFPVESSLQGWTLVQYQGLNLGWIKILKNRINNYLPKEWRIRMEIR